MGDYIIDYGIGHCPICEDFFSKTRKQQIYCCHKCAVEAADRRRYERQKAEKVERVEEIAVARCILTQPDSNADRCECKRKDTCKYAANISSTKYCDYMGITGRVRGGYPDECTVYEPKTGARKPNKQTGWSDAANKKRSKDK